MDISDCTTANGHDINQAKNLLKVSQRDLKALAGMMESDTFADEIFGFHLQQAVEKLLKAWLAALNRRYPLTHSLSLLLQMLEDLDCDISEYRQLSRFTPFAVILQCEEVKADFSIERLTALAQVQALCESVKMVVENAAY